jgi:uncharacterized protein DUF2382/PRC-barrel domain protein
MPDIDTVLGWRGKTVRDRDGDKLGTLGALYLDADTDRPAYGGVHTGLFRRNESVVPLDGAEEIDGDIRLPFAAATVRAAPNVDPDVALDEDEQQRLHEHYATALGEGQAPADGPSRDPAAGEEAPEVVRSEEELRAERGPMRPRERIRLKKYLVTDYVEKTVPVRREEVHVEHDPPDDEHS